MEHTARFLAARLLLAALMICTSPFKLDGQTKSVASEKISSIITTTIEKLKSDGITTKNAHLMNLPSRYNSKLTRFDDGGRLGLLLNVKEVSSTLLSTLRQLGGDIVMALPYSKLVAVYMPIDKIENVALLGEVQFIHPIVGGVTNTGSRTSEGDSIHHAIDVRTDLNVKGDSIKVGVISDGCFSYLAAQGSGDLPAGFGPPNFTYGSGIKQGWGDEGTAMMEIVHDLAPNADIYFYGALYDPAGSLAHIDAIHRLVREKGCKVIVDDITWFNQPMFEDGTPATNNTTAAAAKWAIDTGVVYVSSAGNWGGGNTSIMQEYHYQAMYSDINPGSNVIEGKPLPNGPIIPGLPPNWDDLHFFGADPDPNPAGVVGLKVIMPAWTGYPNPMPKLYAVLEWNDPWWASADDYDLYIYDKNFVMRRAASTGIQNGAQCAWEAVVDSNYEYWDDTVNIVINHRVYSPQPPKLLGLYIYGAKWVEHYTPQNSIWGQPGVPDVIAVGAVPSDDISSIEAYCSEGNYDVYFPNPPGYVSRPKPDLVAVDNVQVTGVGGFGSPFLGTSAAAPHVAAMAALLLSKCPTMTPAQVHAKFERTAVDLGGAGFDPISGNGRIDIERAMLELNTTAGAYGSYTMNNTTNVPMFYATADGYAVSNITVTGGASQPTQVHSKVLVTSGNPYDSAGVKDPGCPTVKRWYDLTKTGGTNGQFNSTVTAYIDESERSAAGIDATNLRVIHWNGSYFNVLPQAVAPARVRDTWKVKATFNNASFSPFFVGHMTRGLSVATVASTSGKRDSTVVVKLSVENTGNSWDTIDVRVHDARDWVFSPAHTAFSLTSGSKDTIDIQVSIPADAVIDVKDSVWLVAKSVSDPSTLDSSFATITVIPTRGVDVATVSNNSGLKSTQVIVKLSTQNTGDDRDSVRIHTRDTRGWTIAPVDSGLGLNAGKKDTVHVRVSIPLGAEVGTIDTVWLIGTSVSESTVKDSAYATVTVISSTTVMSCAMLSGWNLLSVPLLPEDRRKEVLYPTGKSEAYTYAKKYVTDDSLDNGVGYWIKFADTQHVDISGWTITSDTIAVTKGWNMIGSISTPVKVSTITSDPSDMTRSRFWRYNGTGYESADTIKPGIGYWVKVSKTGSLFLSASMLSQPQLMKVVDDDGMPPPPPSGESIATQERPTQFRLEQNYPNPFNPSTDVRYAIPASPAGECDVSFVSLKVYDVLGREVATLVNEVKQPGEYMVRWDTRGLPSGVYYYRLTAGLFVDTKKMIVTK